MERAGAGASIRSIQFEEDSIIDRLLNADPKKCDPADIRELRKWVHGYQAKFGRDKNPHPPDDKILAQLLAVAPVWQIVRLIDDLKAEGKEPGYQYAWYGTVALQRIHGIRPDEVTARRAELKAVPKRHPALTGEQQQFPAPAPPVLAQAEIPQPDPEFGAELVASVRSSVAHDRPPVSCAPAPRPDPLKAMLAAEEGRLVKPDVTAGVQPPAAVTKSGEQACDEREAARKATAAALRAARKAEAEQRRMELRQKGLG
jgi:hypothetical protein